MKHLQMSATVSLGRGMSASNTLRAYKLTSTHQARDGELIEALGRKRAAQPLAQPGRSPAALSPGIRMCPLLADSGHRRTSAFDCGLNRSMQHRS